MNNHGWNIGRLHLVALCLFIGCLLYLAGSSSAQEPIPHLSEEALYPGYIIAPDEDTIPGYFFYKSLLHNQSRIIFYDSLTGSQTIQTFRPDDIKGYMIGGFTYHTVPFSGRYSSRKVAFMHCLAEGRASLYKWYFDEKQQYFEDNAIWDYTDTYEKTLQEQIFVVKKGAPPLELSEYRSPQRFHIRLGNYLSDEPELAMKIRSKTPGYRFENLLSIIREYND